MKKEPIKTLAEFKEEAGRDGWNSAMQFWHGVLYQLYVLGEKSYEEVLSDLGSMIYYDGVNSNVDDDKSVDDRELDEAISRLVNINNGEETKA